ncbi:uncharacterized protein LOC131595192 [Vicia villosa]|uniref:uncharacterized protein LOC131595192 n=1 Tax=Vicia villosa TaxID=3911 RepID=UPI00273AF0D6|nr:uncharacterized protein LOC131595192 [Vicia villosa]
MAATSGIAEEETQVSSSDEIDPRLDVYVWDMDETFILLNSLLKSSYAEAWEDVGKSLSASVMIISSMTKLRITISRFLMLCPNMMMGRTYLIMDWFVDVLNVGGAGLKC